MLYPSDITREQFNHLKNFMFKYKKGYLLAIIFFLISIISFTGWVYNTNSATLTCSGSICKTEEDNNNCSEDCKKLEIDNDPFAILGYGMRAEMQSPLKENLSNIILGTGTNWIRSRWINWGETEPENGKYDWSLVDYYRKQESFNILFNLTSYSSWGSIEDEGSCGYSKPLNQSNITDYESYIFDLVNRSKNEIKYWQIGNEPELDAYWCCPDSICKGDLTKSAKEFVKQLSITYKKIKEADPEAVVVLGGFTGTFRGIEPYRVEIAKYIIANSKDYFDVFDIHLYGKYQDYETKTQWFRDEMASNGYSKPIWSTEMGGPDISNCLNNTEAGAIADLFANPENYPDPYAELGRIINENDCAKIIYNSLYNKEYYKWHAGEVIKRYSHGLNANISKIFWFNLYGRQTIENPPYPQVLRFERMGLVAVDFSKKDNLTKDDYFKTPAYHTYKLMTKKLNNLSSVKNISLGKNVSAYEFNVNGKPVFVLWNDSGQTTVDLSSYVSTENVNITHIVTELNSSNTPIYPANETLSANAITISEIPIFLEEIITPNIFIKIPSSFSLTENQTARVSNDQKMSIKLNEVNSVSNCTTSLCPYFRPNVKVTVSTTKGCDNTNLSCSETSNLIKEYIFYTGKSIEILDTKLELEKIKSREADFKISFIKTTNNCTDSDGGKKYYTKGTVKYDLNSNTTYHYTETDVCNGSTLKEYYCTDNGVAGTKYFDCPNSCQDGACAREDFTCPEIYDSVCGVDGNHKVENKIGENKIQITNKSLYSRIKGRIIFRVEKNGEAYYVHPSTKKMYYLNRPTDAFQVIREQGIGITNSNLEKIAIGSGEKYDSNKVDENFSKKHNGKIFIQTEKNGEAWYVNPNNNKRYYLGRPQDVFNVMRNLGLGISNSDFENL